MAHIRTEFWGLCSRHNLESLDYNVGTEIVLAQILSFRIKDSDKA